MRTMWTVRGNALHKIFSFQDFRTAFEFMQEVAVVAEQLNHHPNWTNCYNVVEFNLSTHEANNSITEKDYQLSEAIDSIWLNFSS